jgi:hypothetical protein
MTRTMPPIDPGSRWRPCATCSCLGVHLAGRDSALWRLVLVLLAAILSALKADDLNAESAMQIRRTLPLLLLPSLFGLGAAAACRQADDPALETATSRLEPAQSRFSGNITLDGSNSVFPVSEAMAAAFQRETPDIRIIAHFYLAPERQARLQRRLRAALAGEPTGCRFTPRARGSGLGARSPWFSHRRAARPLRGRRANPGRAGAVNGCLVRRFEARAG